jgi:hypothetical protein
MAVTYAKHTVTYAIYDTYICKGLSRDNFKIQWGKGGLRRDIFKIQWGKGSALNDLLKFEDLRTFPYYLLRRRRFKIF